MQNTKLNKLYPLQLWVLTIVLTGLTVTLIDSSAIWQGIKMQLLFLSIVVGLLLSIPVFIICYLAFNSLTRARYSTLQIKVIIDLICIVGIVGTFYVISGPLNYRAIFSYSGALILCSIFLRVHKKGQEVNIINVEIKDSEIQLPE